MGVDSSRRSKRRVRTVSFYTSNEGKISEARALLSRLGYRVEWVKSNLTEPQAETLEEVVSAKLKAVPRERRRVVVEDSGFFIDALDGFPGVYSAYALRTIGLHGILKLLEGRRRAAEFRSVVGLREEGRIRLFPGHVRGSITMKERGSNGFGYDPIFMPLGYHSTAAELTLEAKNRVSHRGMALRGLLRWLDHRD